MIEQGGLPFTEPQAIAELVPLIASLLTSSGIEAVDFEDFEKVQRLLDQFNYVITRANKAELKVSDILVKADKQAMKLLSQRPDNQGDLSLVDSV